MGSISLEASAESLDEVVIEAKQIRKPIEATGTGITVRPDQNLSNDGGSVLDVLRTTPSITVADDGSFSIRGSNGTNVLIDGRNSALGEELDQIPANAVESIEVINNPDSKYDAQSAGGILNIKLKKGKGKGTKGNVQTTVGTRGRTNSSIRLNHRSDKFNVYGGYNFRYWPGVRSSESQRIDFTTNEVLDQTTRNLRYPAEHTVNYGGDYFFGKNKLSYEGSASLQSRTEKQDTRVRLFDRSSDETILQYTRLGNENRNESIFDNAIIYERMFDDTTRSFRTYASHSFRDRDSEQGINSYSGTLSPENRDPSGRERFTFDRFIHRGVFQSDYAQNLFGGRFETGVKYNMRRLDNDYIYEIADETGAFINQENVSNRFIYTEQISAGYIQYGNEIGNLEYSFGSRVEWSLIDTEQRTTTDKFQQNYVNLFPSAQLLYNFNDEHAIKASYSRRIDRPGGWRLNPFRDVTDSLNQREGNP
ncbi:MAG: TonB-dependent receptor, partial [Flavobacteriales bacterium]|nr:TonB-dependent receptor [Flavobacteriales bacterium]